MTALSGYHKATLTGCRMTIRYLEEDEYERNLERLSIDGERGERERNLPGGLDDEAIGGEE